MNTCYQNRRGLLLNCIDEGIIVIPTSREKIRNKDAHYPFRPDSYFYYLTGFTEPDAVLVLHKNGENKSTIFCREKNIEKEIWDGFRLGPSSAPASLDVDEAFPIDELDKLMPKFLENQESVYSVIGVDTRWDSKIISWLNHTRSKVRTGIRAPSSLKDIRRYLDEMRLIKDETELNIMRSAAKISSVAHIAAMKATAPNKNEYEVEAELLYHFKKHGSEFPAYTSIVAGGANSCVLHYTENNQKLKDGELLLIDAGCELHGYASDITRTFPINGKYTQAQKEVYSIVLNAQEAAIGQVKAGNSWQAPHEAALKILAEGMVDIGLLKGSVEEVIETEAFSRFYMHRTGHWLGMDVHDVGDYKTNGQWRNLEPGMVLTVEPGMYIRKAPDIPKDFWNIGIRIEDDVVVTGGGCEILTSDTPKSISDIEAIMAN